MEFRVRAVNEQEAETLALLAKDTFCETFGHLYHPQDLEAYITNYSVSVIQKELLDHTRRSYFLTNISGDILGYSMLRFGYTEEGISKVESRSVVELSRFYLLKKYHGTGASGVLMDHTLTQSRLLDAKLIWLGVWESNFVAQNFYQRYGFTFVGKHAFHVGSHVDVDHLIELFL